MNTSPILHADSIKYLGLSLQVTIVMMMIFRNKLECCIADLIDKLDYLIGAASHYSLNYVGVSALYSTVFISRHTIRKLLFLR